MFTTHSDDYVVDAVDERPSGAGETAGFAPVDLYRGAPGSCDLRAGGRQDALHRVETETGHPHRHPHQREESPPEVHSGLQRGGGTGGGQLAVPQSGHEVGRDEEFAERNKDMGLSRSLVHRRGVQQ